MKSSCIYTCILLCLYVCNLHGQTLDDNIVITQCSDSYIFMKKTVFLPYATEKKHPMKPQEWELHCNPTPTTENSFHWTELPPKAEERQNIKASRRKMSSSTTARFASSTSILTVKEKRRKLRLNVLFMTCIILHESIWVRIIL